MYAGLSGQGRFQCLCCNQFTNWYQAYIHSQLWKCLAKCLSLYCNVHLFLRPLGDLYT